VLVGRAVLSGLTLGGAEGAERILTLLKDSLETTITMLGGRSLEDFDRSFVTMPR
jgi:isopentenyl diphosphate isomerase/L-lactate dehydrogenase-like FMN-dependent dehydrogenase